MRPYTLSELEFNIIENGPNAGKVNEHNICDPSFAVEDRTKHEQCNQYKKILTKNYDENGKQKISFLNYTIG